MPLNPKGVTTGKGSDKPNSEAGNLSNIPKVMPKFSREGVDYIVHKEAK